MHGVRPICSGNAARIRVLTLIITNISPNIVQRHPRSRGPLPGLVERHGELLVHSNPEYHV